MAQPINNLTNFLKVRGVLLVGAALLLILASVGLFFFSQTDHIVAANVQATTSIEMKAISTQYVATNSARAGATASVQAQTTATAQADATATAEVVQATTTAFVSGNPYPPHNGTLALDDSLHNNSSSVWSDYTASDGSSSCHFVNGSYHSKMNKINFISTCPAFSTDFRDFIFQVQMNILSGDAGGIDFRSDDSKSNEYVFVIGIDGSYDLYTLTNNKNVGSSLVNDTSSAIKTGTNQTNMIAVVAHGQSIDLYVNNQHIANVNDGSFTHGTIGVVADANTNPAEVAFTNAKVWTL